MHLVAHDHPVRLALGSGPVLPADEAVDRVARLGLVERELVPAATELVGPSLEPVRPRHQHLAPAGRAHLGEPVAVEQIGVPDPVRTQPSPHLDDDGPLLVGCDLGLQPRRGVHESARAFCIAPSKAIAGGSEVRAADERECIGRAPVAIHAAVFPLDRQRPLVADAIQTPG